MSATLDRALSELGSGFDPSQVTQVFSGNSTIVNFEDLAEPFVPGFYEIEFDSNIGSGRSVIYSDGTLSTTSFNTAQSRMTDIINDALKINFERVELGIGSVEGSGFFIARGYYYDADANELTIENTLNITGIWRLG